MESRYTFVPWPGIKSEPQTEYTVHNKIGIIYESPNINQSQRINITEDLDVWNFI